MAKKESRQSSEERNPEQNPDYGDETSGQEKVQEEVLEDGAPQGDGQPATNAEPVDVEALTQKVAELKDQMLRSVAEMENVKRRAAKDVENAHKFAIEKLINDLFPVLDSLEKAVETAAATEGAGPIAEGVSLSLKLFLDTLAKSGVEQIDPLGEPFDPQKHEALTTVANPDAEPNTVMDVMAKGYILNGRLVRAAKVIVVQG